MPNLGGCIEAVLGSALRNPDSSQYYDLKRALKSVSTLVDFTRIAEYRSDTPDIVSYMERYPQIFHRTKVILLEFRTLKATRAQANHQDRELMGLIADQHEKEFHHTTIANHRWLAAQESVQRSDQWVDLIRCENHFNFIQIHYLRHFAFHVQHFGCILMYSTEIGELAHKN